MLVNQRRSLIASAVLLGGAVTVGVLVAVPATRDWVQTVDDAARDLAVDVRNGPSTAVAKALSLIGSVWVIWPLRGLIASDTGRTGRRPDRRQGRETHVSGTRGDVRPRDVERQSEVT